MNRTPRGSKRTVVTLVWKESPTNPLIREQVLERSQAFRSIGLESSVVLGLDADDIPPDPIGPHVEVSRAGGLASLVRLARRTMSRPAGSGPRPVLICRGALVASAALIARRGRDWAVVHDARGWYAAESIDKQERRGRTMTKRMVERHAFRQSDQTVCVSQALLGIALAEGADPARTSVIPPFVAPAEVDAVSGEDADRCDVLYVGNSWLPYQARPLIEPLLAGIADAIPEAQFCWLDAAAPADPERLAPNLSRRSVSFEEVPGYLRRAKVALLMRTPAGVNAAAAPTKATQYLAAGCRIVSSDYPPSIAELCRVTGRGRAVRGMDPVTWSDAVRQELALEPVEGLHLGDSVVENWDQILGSV